MTETARTFWHVTKDGVWLQPHESESAAIAWTQKQIVNTPGEYIIYHCVPVKRAHIAIDDIALPAKPERKRRARKPKVTADMVRGILAPPEPPPIDPNATSQSTTLQGGSPTQTEIPTFLRREKATA